MKPLVTYQVTPFMAVIEQAGIPALRIVFSVALLLILSAGVLIFRKRRQFFDRDPGVANDVPVVRHNREEIILSVWTALTLVLITCCSRSGAFDMHNLKAAITTQICSEN